MSICSPLRERAKASRDMSVRTSVPRDQQRPGAEIVDLMVN